MYIWYSKSTAITGKALARHLRCAGGIHPPSHRAGLIIGWGARCKRQDEYAYEQMRFVNKVSAINRASNKLRAFEIFRENGIRIPEIRKTTESARELFAHGQNIVLARSKIHRAGNDIVVVTSSELLQYVYADFFVQYIESVKEYRVHVYRNKIIRVGEKIPVAPIKSTIIKSRPNGWHIEYLPRGNRPISLLNDARIAVSSLGLDFGVVDMIIDSDRRAFVLEVNTGPGLDDTGIRIYGRKFEVENNA